MNTTMLEQAVKNGAVKFSYSYNYNTRECSSVHFFNEQDREIGYYVPDMVKFNPNLILVDRENPIDIATAQPIDFSDRSAITRIDDHYQIEPYNVEFGYCNLFYKSELREQITFWIRVHKKEHEFCVSSDLLHNPSKTLKQIKMKLIELLDMNSLIDIRFKSYLNRL